MAGVARWHQSAMPPIRVYDLGSLMVLDISE